MELLFVLLSFIPAIAVYFMRRGNNLIEPAHNVPRRRTVYLGEEV